MSDTTSAEQVDELPEQVVAMIGVPMYPETATFPAELSYGYNTLAATQNANPLFWDAEVADELTAAPREGRRGSDGRHPRTARRI